MQTTQNITSTIIEAIQDKKGQKIITIDLSHLEMSSASEFIICQGRSTSQVAAIADNIRDELSSRFRIKPYHYDGYRNSQWIILDYGSTMIHIFLPEVREFYNLEELWGDGVTTEIPDLD